MRGRTPGPVTRTAPRPGTRGEQADEQRTTGGPGTDHHQVDLRFLSDPEEGGPDGGVDPGTPFEDIADDRMCPICGAAEADFRALEPGEFPED